MSSTLIFPNYTIGVDAYDKIGDICSRYGKKAVVIGGKTAMSKAKDDLLAAAEKNGFEITDFCFFGGEACSEYADALVQNEAVKRADMIFAVGGGKACDLAKIVQIKTDKPLFTFPTIASTCAPITQITITYYTNGESKETLKMKQPPIHVFINSRIIAQAPSKFLWAGIGDTLGKYYEVSFSCRGVEIDYQNQLGLALAPFSSTALLTHGKKAFDDCKNGVASEELEQIVLDLIVTTGLVSILVDNKFNTALAHAVYYGFTMLDAVKESHLHGEVVSYGVLVQLMLDNHPDLKKVYEFNKKLGLPTCLKDLDISTETPLFDEALQKAADDKGLKVVPYTITKEMIKDAIIKLDAFKA